MKRFYGGIVALLLAGNVLAQTATQTAVPAALRGLTTAEHRAGGFSGCILVQQQNKPVWDTCIGLPDASFTVDQALFPLASISKAVTASLVMRAHAYGELDLNTPLTAYLPGLLPKKWGKRITPYHLLTHTSGLPAPEALPEQETTLARYLTQFLTEDQPYQKPGRFQYNDLDYVLLDTLLEQQTRTQFWQLLVQELWLNSDFKLELFTDDYLPDSLAAFVVPPAETPRNAPTCAWPEPLQAYTAPQPTWRPSMSCCVTPAFYLLRRSSKCIRPTSQLLMPRWAAGCTPRRMCLHVPKRWSAAAVYLATAMCSTASRPTSCAS